MNKSQKSAVLNQVVQGLLNQGEISINKNGRYSYHGPKGLRCSVGLLIPEYNHRKSFEGISLEPDEDPQKIVDQILTASGLDGEQEFAYRLQMLHDDIEPNLKGKKFYEAVLDNAEEVAEDLGLKLTKATTNLFNTKVKDSEPDKPKGGSRKVVDLSTLSDDDDEEDEDFEDEDEEDEDDDEDDY